MRKTFFDMRQTGRGVQRGLVHITECLRHVTQGRGSVRKLPRGVTQCFCDVRFGVFHMKKWFFGVVK